MAKMEEKFIINKLKSLHKNDKYNFSDHYIKTHFKEKSIIKRLEYLLVNFLIFPFRETQFLQQIRPQHDYTKLSQYKNINYMYIKTLWQMNLFKMTSLIIREFTIKFVATSRIFSKTFHASFTQSTYTRKQSNIIIKQAGFLTFINLIQFPAIYFFERFFTQMRVQIATKGLNLKRIQYDFNRAKMKYAFRYIVAESTLSSFLYNKLLKTRDCYILDYYYFINRISQMLLFPLYHIHKQNLAGVQIKNTILQNMQQKGFKESFYINVQKNIAFLIVYFLLFRKDFRDKNSRIYYNMQFHYCYIYHEIIQLNLFNSINL